MSLAILCSGQGNQHPGMFDLTAELPEAADVFAAATQVLDGRDPRKLVRDTSVDIHANALGQVLCCTQALAAFTALRGKLGSRLVIAGYSVGEVASWGCAGLTETALTLDLARRRAAAMDAAGRPDDGLAYVRGLSRDAVDKLCAAHDLGVAIVNPGDMFVIGGARTALTAACDEAMASGASHSGALKVHVASHTRRLAAASETFRIDLRQVTTTRVDPRVRLLSGIDATTVRNVPAGLDKLAGQIAHTIEWAGCLDACAEAGMAAALELGPGNALATMTATAHPGVNARSLDDFRSLAGVERWLTEVTG